MSSFPDWDVLLALFSTFLFSLIVVQRHWATFYHLNKVVGTIIGQFVARSTSVVYFDSNDDCSTGVVPDAKLRWLVLIYLTFYVQLS